jgi:hypothetical protein
MKLRVTHTVKKLPALIEPEVSLRLSQEQWLLKINYLTFSVPSTLISNIMNLRSYVINASLNI